MARTGFVFEQEPAVSHDRRRQLQNGTGSFHAEFTPRVAGFLDRLSFRRDAPHGLGCRRSTRPTQGPIPAAVIEEEVDTAENWRCVKNGHEKSRNRNIAAPQAASAKQAMAAVRNCGAIPRPINGGRAQHANNNNASNPMSRSMSIVAMASGRRRGCS